MDCGITLPFLNGCDFEIKDYRQAFFQKFNILNSPSIWLPLYVQGCMKQLKPGNVYDVYLDIWELYGSQTFIASSCCL